MLCSRTSSHLFSQFMHAMPLSQRFMRASYTTGHLKVSFKKCSRLQRNRLETAKGRHNTKCIKETHPNERFLIRKFSIEKMIMKTVTCHTDLVYLHRMGCRLVIIGFIILRSRQLVERLARCRIRILHYADPLGGSVMRTVLPAPSRWPWIQYGCTRILAIVQTE